ncbi:MAG: AmmeMemoRadiSam system protein B [Ignavibacteriae bacterium]|nr:MAG: AmmeMemoRadiSam system protein B [Ignavibacteriota bacterium]
MIREKDIVRPPTVAGLFYDNSPEVLRENVEEFIDQARVPDRKVTVRGLVAPHAGYVYSGLAAAHSYKMIKGASYDCVIIVGPSHREYFDGVSVFPGEAYETPLGKIPVNHEVREDLLKSGNIIAASENGHRTEHSIEVQLPFLQSVLGEFSFVPLIMGDQRRQLCEGLSVEIVRVAKNRNILLVASSDLSHYHPYDDAVTLDTMVISEIENYNSDSFITNMEKNSFEACGGGPIAVVMSAAYQLGAGRAEILFYCNSGDVSGEKDGVVGYLAAAFV